MQRQVCGADAALRQITLDSCCIFIARRRITASSAECVTDRHPVVPSLCQSLCHPLLSVMRFALVPSYGSESMEFRGSHGIPFGMGMNVMGMGLAFSKFHSHSHF